MSDLRNQTPSTTYKGLLQVNDYSNGVDATSKFVQDGEGTNSALSISTTKVGVGTSTPLAPLDVTSTTGGVVFPRLNTAQRDLISSPTDGETIYNTTTTQVESYNGTDWVAGGTTVVATNAVTSDSIVNDAVTTAKIAADAVTSTEIAANAVTSGKIAAGAVTHDKISTTDSVFKINSSDQIRIGGDLSDAGLQSISQVGITSSSASAVMTIESTGATNDGILVCTAQRDAIIQLKDASQSATDKGIYNISSADGKFAVGSVAAGGGGSNKQVIVFERKTLSAVDYIVPEIPNLPTFADNSAATSGGLATNDVYKTSTGELRIVV